MMSSNVPPPAGSGRFPRSFELAALSLLILVIIIETLQPPATGTYWAVLPPLLAIGLTFLTANVYLSLIAAIYISCLLQEQGGPIIGFLRLFDRYLVEEIAPSDGSTTHAEILLFTLLMGGFVELTRQTGIGPRLVNRFQQQFRSRWTTQTGISVSGLILFFDDYANCLLLGTSFRQVCDRMRISREKLAFLVDGTAAPVAGIAIISTWVGVELSYFSDGLTAIGYDGPVYGLFLQTIPYRLYPICMLAFVLMVSLSGRDFGPMWQAEQEAQQQPVDTHSETLPAVMDMSNDPVRLSQFDMIPFVVLVAGLLIGLAYSGWSTAADSEPDIPVTIMSVLDQTNPNQAMLWASAASVLTISLIGYYRYQISLQQLTEACLSGMQSMLPALVIIWFAWTLSTLCSPAHLNVAEFFTAQLTEQFPVFLLPAVIFLLCAAISFSTGSSWSTMGIMFPIGIPLVAACMSTEMTTTQLVHSPLLAACTGSILAGAIWGDHCSPISDTTVLSSAAAGCDHFEHVRTQLPYAIAVGTITLLLGLLPIGFGISVWFVLPVCLLGCWLMLSLFGQKINSSSHAVKNRV